MNTLKFVSRKPNYEKIRVPALKKNPDAVVGRSQLRANRKAPGGEVAPVERAIINDPRSWELLNGEWGFQWGGEWYGETNGYLPRPRPEHVPDGDGPPEVPPAEAVEMDNVGGLGVEPAAPPVAN